MALAASVSLPYHQLIGAPLVALIDAEAHAARASAEFLQSVGFIRSPGVAEDSFGHLRTVTFTYLKQDVNGADVTEEIELPLLSLLPIPLLQIKDASLEFELKVTEIEQERGKIDKSERRVVLKGAYSSQRSAESKVNSEATVKIRINVAQSDIPVGLTKLFQIMDLGTASRPTKREQSPK